MVSAQQQDTDRDDGLNTKPTSSCSHQASCCSHMESDSYNPILVGWELLAMEDQNDRSPSLIPIHLSICTMF